MVFPSLMVLVYLEAELGLLLGAYLDAELDLLETVEVGLEPGGGTIVRD
jgi:hypothetical protein